MSDDETTIVPVRMKKWQKERYQQIAKQNGCTLAEYTRRALENYVNPLPQTTPPMIDRELDEINRKLEVLYEQKQNLLDADDLLRGQAATEAKKLDPADHQRIRQKIFKVLLHSPVPLSELVIASNDGVQEDADVVLLVLSDLEQHQIPFLWNGKRYLITHKEMNWSVTAEHS
jgi:hypothetical protein